jgi:hypothetical protein
MPAEKGNKYAAGNKGGGRKERYKEEYAQMAYNYCLLGAIDEQLAGFFGVTEKTINEWKKIHEEFGLALKKGKDEADAVIAQKLFHRAKGYEHPEDKIFNDNGSPMIVPTIKHYPPDTTAAIFWLKNRQPAKWRDRQEIDSTVKSENLNINVAASEDELMAEAERIIRDLGMGGKG